MASLRGSRHQPGTHGVSSVLFWKGLYAFTDYAAPGSRIQITALAEQHDERYPGLHNINVKTWASDNSTRHLAFQIMIPNPYKNDGEGFIYWNGSIYRLIPTGIGSFRIERVGPEALSA